MIRCGPTQIVAEHVAWFSFGLAVGKQWPTTETAFLAVFLVPLAWIIGYLVDKHLLGVS